MPEFDYRYVTEEGTVFTSVIDADSKFDVYEVAEKRNEMVLSVKKHKSAFDVTKWINSLRRVSPQELENFTSQLSVMLDSGVPLIGCLEAIQEQSETETMRKIIEEVIERVNEGKSFSQALSSYPRVFNTLYVNMVKVGEITGVLDQILNRLGSFFRNDIEVARNIKSAIRYPMIVLTALLTAFTSAIIFIIPKFSRLFTAQGVELPLPTRVMLNVSHFVVDYWWLVIMGIVGFVSGLLFYIRTSKGAYMFDLFKLNVPVFKEIIVKSTISRFAHILETMTHSGIQIVRALDTTEKTVGNLVISNEIRKARERVEQGVSLSDALSDSKYFPRMTLKMIAVGEQAGALEKMLQNVAQQYDTTVDEKIKRLSASIEPIMTLVMGGFLLMIALGIFLPMWNMYSVVK